MIGTWFVLSVSGCALGKLAALGRSYPQLDGELAAPHASAELKVIRDVYGVPHVRAASEADAWYGLGFAHAQDRLFELDLSRHTADGTLAAWFGADAAQYDVFARALGLRDRAQALVDAADPETRAMLDAYAAGINDGAAASKVLPIEYRLLDAEFEPWTAADDLATVFLLSWTLSENLDFELAALALRDLDRDTLDAVLRVEPQAPPIDPYWDTMRTWQLGELTPAFRAFTGLLGGAPASRTAGDAAASNNWVIGGELSASGKPIVANDPHLAQRVPSLWYAAELRGGDLHVAGATLPGLPGVVIGHSERVAWGLTNVMADNVDLAVVERVGERGYVLEGQQKELREVKVEVPVRDGAPVTGSVWFTDVGPVITALDGTHLVALRWAALEVDDQLVVALRALNRASSVGDALGVAGTVPLIVANNLVLGDVDGDYAWRQVGAFVGRRLHTGRVPYPASDPMHGWYGWLGDAPGEHHPDRHYVVTANSRPDHPLADAISTTYVPPHRFERIDEALAGATALTPEDSQALQLDLLDGTARWHRDELLDGVTATTPRGELCRDLLARWDLVADRDAIGATVWAAFHEAYVRDVLTDAIGADDAAIALSLYSSARSPLDGGGLDALVKDRPATVAKALDQACARLASGLGEDPTGWTWGPAHALHLRHPFTARAPKLLKRWDLPTVPFGGTGATVAAASSPWGEPGAAFPVGGMASLRVVMPLADLGASTLVHPGGQSGQPGNPLYASHYAHFVNGQTLPLWFDDEDVAANAHWTTVLKP
ncbi:MAG: penicillin acylase family protein [Myxococcota bacterium]